MSTSLPIVVFVRRATAAALSAFVIAVAEPSIAGQCPAGKQGVNVQKPGATQNNGVTDVVLSQIDLANEKLALKGHMFRMRRLVVQPGGKVAWHSHADRPALIYVLQGQILEYASTCAVPILHRAGDVARETHQTAHWWHNKSRRPVVLLSVDIRRDPNDRNM